jgi:glycine dehydrogenase subunit 2
MSDMKLIFEKSRRDADASRCGAGRARGERRTCCRSRDADRSARLPEVSEPDLVRHYTALSAGPRRGQRVLPMGSCTMKYNPASARKWRRAGFTDIHPLQGDATSQGCLALIDHLSPACADYRMDAMTFQPAAGAHGEWTACCLSPLPPQPGEDRPMMLVPIRPTEPIRPARPGGFRVQPVPRLRRRR